MVELLICNSMLTKPSTGTNHELFLFPQNWTSRHDPIHLNNISYITPATQIKIVSEHDLPSPLNFNLIRTNLKEVHNFIYRKKSMLRTSQNLKNLKQPSIQRLHNKK